jgi:hypothetical protein
MPDRYVNAADVLPPEVLEGVLDALNGRSTCLWVPARKNVNRRGRNEYVVRLYQADHSAADIAERLLISERTVWRILAKARAQRPPSGRAPSGR